MLKYAFNENPYVFSYHTYLSHNTYERTEVKAVPSQTVLKLYTELTYPKKSLTHVPQLVPYWVRVQSCLNYLTENVNKNNSAESFFFLGSDQTI